MSAIIRIPVIITSSASFHLKIPAQLKMATPTKPARIIESEYNCTAKVAIIANTAIHSVNLAICGACKLDPVVSALSSLEML